MTRRHTRATLRIQHKLDQMALDDLRAIVQDQHYQILDLERRLRWAEDRAESWRDDALRAIEEAGLQPGLTMDGRVLALPHQGGVQ